MGETGTRKKPIIRVIRAACCISAGIVLLTAVSVSCCGVAHAQETPTPEQQPPPPVPGAQPVRVPTPLGTATCLQPPPLVSWKDYEGRFAKVVGVFGRKLERKTVVHPRMYKPGARLCTLEVKDKFMLFVKDTVDPTTFLSAAFNSGISQAQNDDPSYGQGAAGYGRRVGFNIIDQAQGHFFQEFVYPTIFSEDPRYYRLGSGPGGHRLLHALEHSAVAYKEDGSKMPNYSLWFGTTSSVLLSNVYHPDNARGFGPNAENVGLSVAIGMGFDVLREFWPEIARKSKIPFRGENAPGIQNTGAAKH